jgi:hypothetical protein
MQPAQRLDPQVAVDQHQPIGVADHDHRHLLPDLGHRSDQPPALLAVVDPQIAVPELELVQVHLHAVTLPALRRHLHLVLRLPLGASPWAPPPGQLRRISLWDQVLASASRLASTWRGLAPLPQGSPRVAG